MTGLFLSLGAFLSANKLCLPSSLSSLQKADWSRVGRSVVETVIEICGLDELRVYPNTVAGCWKKRIVCVVWLKLLCGQAEEDVETAWRENPFFPLQNGLPEVSHVVLLELVKSLAAADIFAHFLLCLPQAQVCVELERLTQHVKSSPTGEDDVRLFLEVWWELWKGKNDQRAGREEGIEAMFANQFAHLSSKSCSLSPQAAKRLKLDTSAKLASSPTTDVLHILLHALKDIKDHISTTDLCLQALSISLDSLYTAFLIDQEVILPTKEKMHMLSKAVSIREKNDEKLSPELIQEALRDLHASHTPSHFKPSTMRLGEALKIITDLTQFWLNSQLLKVCDSTNFSYSAFKLEQSVQRVLTAIEKADVPEAITEMNAQETEKNILRGLLKSLALPAIETTPKVDAEVTMTIINHHLEDHQNFAVLFASEKSWASCDEQWLDCLEKNQAAFQQHNTLVNLASILMSKLHSESSNVSHCRKLMKVIADIFSALSLEDKNKSLAAMLKLSTRGFFGHSVPPAVADGFEQELNMAFNCIIQGGGGASAAESQGNLNTAASLVARVAFQNPVAALTNDKTECNGEERKETKSLLASEKEQLVKFLGRLMMPVMAVDGEERRQCFLSPQEVVNIFVLPNLSTMGEYPVIFMLPNFDPASSPHWVLDCSPFPLLYILAQLHNQALRFWEQPSEGAVHHWSMDTKELLVSVLTTLGQVIGAEVAVTPNSWSRALFWLYNKMEELDWTVRFHLKPVWREHFKNEVPSSLLTVCELPEQEWSALDLPQYSQGSGLLAWMECCSISDSLRSTMLSCLLLDQRQPDHVNMFSKGLLVALTQTLPWCSVSQWSRLLGALRELITSGRLHVPFSLEYVDYLPLLDLRRFSCELRLSVLLLRVLQLLCGSSCSHWLLADGWAHVAAKLSRDSLKEAEVLFVLSQLFCHVQHIQVMMPGGQCEPLFLASLEILSHYEAIMTGFPDSSTPLESDNTRHFFSTITDNLENQEMKAVLQQKIAQLVSSS
uniref:Gem (nuclear organelle) associated protein 4 n=1 Tax=Lates calcarifer TaxID=8187 RepID=A0A4W6BJ47_LATCA